MTKEMKQSKTRKSYDKLINSCGLFKSHVSTKVSNKEKHLTQIVLRKSQNQSLQTLFVSCESLNVAISVSHIIS